MAKIENGAKIGLNIANLNGSDDKGLETKNGFVIGYFIALQIGPNLAVQPELLYTQKGSQGNVGNLNTKFSMNYIEVPVLLRYMFSTSGDSKLFLVFGPALALNVKGEVVLSSGGKFLSIDMANQKSVDFGLVMGGGVSIESGHTRILLEARYTVGLSNAFSDVPPFDSNDALSMFEFPMAWGDGRALDLKTGTMTFMIGVQL